LSNLLKKNENLIVLQYISNFYIYYHSIKIAKVFYNTTVDIEIMSEEMIGEFSNVIFKLRFKNEAYTMSLSKSSMRSAKLSKKPQYELKTELFFELFPFHIIFDRDMKIASMGEALNSALKRFQGEKLTKAFCLKKPLIDFTWDDVN
jgi:guanylate cyclase